MLKVFASPSHYVQGPEATASLGAQMAGLGLAGPVLVIAGNSARSELAEVWQKSLGAA